jgi:hypothetical protein
MNSKSEYRQGLKDPRKLVGAPYTDCPALFPKKQTNHDGKEEE